MSDQTGAPPEGLSQIILYQTGDGLSRIQFRKDALPVHNSGDPSAPAVRRTEEQIREKHPWDYQKLTEECAKRYNNFKRDKTYHAIRKGLLGDPRFGAIRFLDPGNLKNAKKPFFNPNILNELDKHYTKKVATRRGK